jgi:cbb3-type cytochrome oxidase subunit 1
VRMNKLWVKIALFNFLIAASIGVLLRYVFVQSISWLHFKNFLHAHSHGAMLGWVFLMLYGALIHSFLPQAKQNIKKYHLLFWGFQVSVIGMFLSFPMQGYVSVSIPFSTLHIILSYIFIYHFLKDLPSHPQHIYSQRFVKTALFFLAFL